VEIDGDAVAFDASGVDQVVFRIAPNAGEPARPLAKIASGGELSRVALAIRAILNGETLQDSTTANLIFGIDEIISYASQTSTLEAGDLILTGTPAGVGVFRDPQRLLQPGDEITIEIDGVGSLTNPVVAG